MDYERIMKSIRELCEQKLQDAKKAAEDYVNTRDWTGVEFSMAGVKASYHLGRLEMMMELLPAQIGMILLEEKIQPKGGR